MPTLIRTYQFQDSGNFSIDCSGGVTMVVILTVANSINSASLSGVNFILAASNHVAYGLVGVSGTLTISMNPYGAFYVLCYGGANFLRAADYQTQYLGPFGTMGMTLSPTAPGDGLCIMNYYNNFYVDQETAGWTQDYYLDGMDGKNIWNMRHKAAAGSSEYYSARNNSNSTGNTHWRVMAAVGFKGGVSFIGVY